MHACVINLSSDSPANNGTLDGLLAVATIDAGAGINTLNISDEASTAADTDVLMTGDSVTGLGPEPIHYLATGGTFGGGINIEAGSGGNHIEIRSTNSSQGTTTTVSSGNGDDVVLVTEIIPASLVINGQAGNDLIDATGVTTDLVITGGAGDDIITTGSGNDQISGDEGDDRIIAGLGSDNIKGGDGRDVLLGDTGVIMRISSDDGSWSSNLLLTDVGKITKSVNLNGLEDLNLLASDILSADLLLLTGAYNADGTRHLIPVGRDCREWETGLLLIFLAADGNDTLDGGAGDDALFGGRGNDNLAGGVGRDYLEGGLGDDTLDGGEDDDVLVGDNSAVASTGGAVANVVRGLNLLSETDSNTLIPFVTVVPGHDINLLTSLLPQITQDLSLIPAVNALVDADGTDRLPLASIVPDIAHHRALLAGNDTLHGGAGNDQLTGDDSTELDRSLTITPELMERAEQIAADLHQISDLWADFTADLLMAGGKQDSRDSVVVDGTFQIGNDNLDGGTGADMIVGDDRVLSTPSLTAPLCLVDDLRSFIHGLDQIEDNFWDASRDLSDFEHSLRDVVTLVPHGKHFDTRVEHHIDRLSIGNDLLDGGDDNDLLVGDDWTYLAPSITITRDEWVRRHDHDHDQWKDHHHGHRNSPADILVAGNDTLNGGAGNDLLFGDSAIFLISTVTAPRDPHDGWHQGQDLAEDLLGVGGPSHNGDDGDDKAGGNDLMDGGDGDDILFGEPGRDTLHGGPGNDWLIGGPDKDILDDPVGHDHEHQGENESKALREALANRLIEFGIYNGCPLALKFRLPAIFAPPS